MRIDTLGILIDHGYAINAHCGACPHSAWLNLSALAARLGRDHGALHHDLVPVLRCTKCGSRDVSIRLHPPTRPERKQVRQFAEIV